MIKLTQIVHGDQSAPNLYHVRALDGSISILHRSIDASLDYDSERFEVTQIGTYDLTMNDIRDLIQDAQNLLRDKSVALSRSRRVIYIKPGASGKSATNQMKKKAAEEALQNQINELQRKYDELKAKLNPSS